eukprot:10323-Heterococcus_DN1.PRE.10
MFRSIPVRHAIKLVHRCSSSIPPPREATSMDIYLADFRRDNAILIRELEERLKCEAIAVEQRAQKFHDTLRADMKEWKTEIRADIKAGQPELRADMKAVQTELRADLKAVHTELRADVNELKAETKANYNDLKNLDVYRKSFFGVAILSVIMTFGPTIMERISKFSHMVQ